MVSKILQDVTPLPLYTFCQAYQPANSMGKYALEKICASMVWFSFTNQYAGLLASISEKPSKPRACLNIKALAFQWVEVFLGQPAINHL